MNRKLHKGNRDSAEMNKVLLTKRRHKKEACKKEVEAETAGLGRTWGRCPSTQGCF